MKAGLDVALFMVQEVTWTNGKKSLRS
jgi:hypothetical protein